MSSDSIVVEQTYDASIAVVWKAITNKDQMRQWFFEPMPDFEPEVGFETEFNVRCDNHDYLHQWKLTHVVPNARIVYDWRYGGVPGSSSVTWELSETSGGTTLKLTHRGNETFPQDNPIFSRESGIAGWTCFVQESLKAFLERQNS